MKVAIGKRLLGYCNNYCLLVDGDWQLLDTINFRSFGFTVDESEFEKFVEAVASHFGMKKEDIPIVPIICHE